MNAVETRMSYRARIGGALAVLALRDVPFWKRSRFRKVCRVFAFAAYTYIGVLVVLLALENFLLFHPTAAARDWAPPPPELTVEDVDLTAADGTRIHAWWAAPPGWKPARGAVLYAHGNGGNLSYRGDLVLRWQKEMDTGVLIFDYPGFGRSGGKPTETGCYEAGQAAYDWLIEAKGVRQEDILLFGGSLGGAIVTELAVRKPGRALVLVATFTSFPDMAQTRYPFFPGRWLVRNQLNSVGKIGQVRCPVFIAHGTDDGLIPHAQGERLFDAAAEPKFFLSLVGFHHGENPAEPFYEALRCFLANHAPLPRK
jgi:fermentation-respiration switch protein FrsA (DUF1100 family)